MMDRLQHALPFLAIGLFVGMTAAVDAAAPTPENALALKPVQPGVDYEKVEPANQSECKVIDIDQDDWSGWEVIAKDGTLLRRFADTNGDQQIDLWCYFRFGVEVYRDIDENFNGKTDQYRWLATGGTRWGLDADEDGLIDAWKQISAEEVTAEVVAALRERDADRFAPLVISDKEMSSLGLGDAKKKQIGSLAMAATRGFDELAKEQEVVGNDAEWVQFAAGTPGVVPSGTEESTRDLIVYENAVAMFDQESGGGQFMVGTLVQVGPATWRVVSLPVLGEDTELLTGTGGNFFAPDTATANAVMNDAGTARKTQDLVTKLENVDTQLVTTKDAAAIAKLHEARAGIIEKLIGAAATKEDREIWFRQLVDTLSVSSQTGAYPAGLTRLQSVSQRFAAEDESLSAYADYQAISADYMARQTPNADFAKVQEWYIGALARFVERYPRAPETAQAWLNLALSKEFEDKDSEALAYYKKVANLFPEADSGEMAAGAVRRLESVGRQVELQGTTIKGKPFRLSSLRGKPVVVHYWATWCEPCKQDMKQLRRLLASNQRTGLQVVGINVDRSKTDAQRYLQQTQVPWLQLHEDGGLEGSRLAKEFGVQTLPTMMLIDPSGKVIRHNIRAAELQTELEKIKQRSR
ncbi:TlpA family protein disulfide reductase [bacterium]|nr:TlpA family protein disulfide reductase [bacterium]